MGNSASDSDTVIKNEYPALPNGLELNGYIIGNELGRGGFGITYRAHEKLTPRHVVIKENFPRAYARRNPVTHYLEPQSTKLQSGYNWSLTHFIDEAAILSELDHPNIVTVLTTFEAQGTAYYVMKPINGTELHLALPGPDKLTEQRLLPILRDLLDALEHLHEQKLLHRDIKVSNILLRRSGAPMLIDFGLARLRGKNSAFPVGTKGYSPRELYTGKEEEQGPWSDLYALGATLHVLMTGTTPPDSVERSENDSYLPLAEQAELSSRYSLKLLSSIDKALRCPIGQRWQSAREWLNFLDSPQKEVTSQPHKSPERPSHCEPTVPSPPIRESGVSPVESGHRAGKVLLAAVVILLGVYFGLGYTAGPHLATQYNKPQLLRSFLALPNIDANRRNHEQDTMLHIAAKHGYTECAQILLSTPGIDMNAINADGMTPKQLAEQSGNNQYIEILQKARLNAMKKALRDSAAAPAQQH